MSISKICIDYSLHRYGDGEFNVKTTVIENGLTNNPNFPTLATEVPIIKELHDRYASFLVKAEDGSHQDILNKNNARTALENQLKLTALLVQNISKGDESMILSAGFDVNRKATPIGTLPKPTNLTAKAGDNFGSLEISWDVIPGAYVYEIEYTESPRTETSKVTHISTSKHKCMIDGQKRGQAISVFVAGVGSDPRRVWSDELISYVM